MVEVVEARKQKSQRNRETELTPPSLASPELPMTSSIPSNASTTATSRVPPPRSTTRTVSSSKGRGGCPLEGPPPAAGGTVSASGVRGEGAPSAPARGEPRP